MQIQSTFCPFNATCHNEIGWDTTPSSLGVKAAAWEKVSFERKKKKTTYLRAVMGLQNRYLYF